MWSLFYPATARMTFWVALVLITTSTLQVVAEPTSCAGADVSVDADDSEITAKICEMVPKIRERLGNCGLEQRRSLTIVVVNELSHPMADCAAYFDCEYDLIRLTSPDFYSGFFEDQTAYAQLPTEVTMKSLLTHELAHALATQSAGNRRLDTVDQEYIAAAMELDLMEPQWRKVVLDAHPVSLPPKEGLVDIWIYGFVPRKFAVNAWNHFRQPEHGCQLIRRIVAGEMSFAKAIRPELR